MSKAIYLAGPMTGMTVTDSRDTWRARASGIFEPLGVECLNPVRGWNKVSNSHIMKARGEDDLRIKEVEGKLHFQRDVADIRRANALYVNTQGAQIVSIGTVSEMAMAYILGVPIVAILDPIHVHLFTEQETTVVCESEEQAVACLRDLLNV